MSNNDQWDPKKNMSVAGVGVKGEMKSTELPKQSGVQMENRPPKPQQQLHPPQGQPRQDPHDPNTHKFFGQFEYAGFWIRFAAVAIDSLILVIVHYAFGMILLQSKMPGEMVVQFQNLISIPTAILYFSYFHSSHFQATPGKMFLGLQVDDAVVGGQIGFGKAILRYFAWVFSMVIIYIGFIMAAFTKKKQGLHDVLCKTVVIKAKKVPLIMPMMAGIGSPVLMMVLTLGIFMFKPELMPQDHRRMAAIQGEMLEGTEGREPASGSLGVMEQSLMKLNLVGYGIMMKAYHAQNGHYTSDLSKTIFKSPSKQKLNYVVGFVSSSNEAKTENNSGLRDTIMLSKHLKMELHGRKMTYRMVSEASKVCPDCFARKDSYKLFAVANLDSDPKLDVFVLDNGEIKHLVNDLEE